MTPADARIVVSHLVDAFPHAQLRAETVRVYEKSLSDFTIEEAYRAINTWTATERFFPAIAALRELIMEERLQLPQSIEAWELVQERIAWRPTEWENCLQCAGLGTRLYEPGDDGRTAEEVACSACRGAGRTALGEPPSLDDVTQRALDLVGGLWAVRHTDQPGIMRAQFLKAHESFRQQAIRTANLISLGVLEPAAIRLALEEAS